MALQNVYEIDVDIKQRTAVKTPNITQNDAVVFNFNIFDEGRTYNIEEGTNFTLLSTRKDGQSVLTEGVKTGANQVQFELGTTELSSIGKVEAVIQVYNVDGRVSTIPFMYYVLNDPSNNYVPSENEKTLIERVLWDSPQILADAETATSNANTAAQNAQAVADANKTRFLPAVDTVATRNTTYPNPSHGDTVRVTSEAKTYRYVTGTGWVVTEAYDPTVINEITKQIDQSNRQTQTLTHGTQVVGSSGAVGSPLKVEFYGNTLVNLGGEIGNIEKYGDTYNSFQGSKTSGIVKIFSYYTNTVKTVDGFKVIDGKYLEGDLNNRIEIIGVSGKYYLIVADVKKEARLDIPTMATSKETSYNNANWGTTYGAFLSDGTTTKVIMKSTYNTEDAGYFKNIRVFEITQDQYNKIGVSLTDAQVAELFPYVDSVQHVKNPVLSVEGENIFPANNKELADFFSDSPYQNGFTYEQSTDSIIGGWARTTKKIPVAPSTNYVLSYEAIMTYIVGVNKVVFYDSNGTKINDLGLSDSASETFKKFSYPFTTPLNCTQIAFTIDNGKNDSGNKYRNFMLNLGTTPKPFVSKNTSYLYFSDVTLAGNDSKKDIVSYNGSAGRWEKIKWWETDVVLDGSLAWEINSDYTGVKRIILRGFSNALNTSEHLYGTKYDGKPIIAGSTAENNVGDYAQIASNILHINISDSDSGWFDSWTSSTYSSSNWTNLIKAYFNGWKYTGDGTTHSWVSIVDGTTAPTEQTLNFVANPANKPTGYKNYFLSYQRATPVIEEVKVEGDVVLNGLTQVTVGSEFTYTTDDKGKRTYTITPANQRTGANLTEVRATFANNIRTALDETVKKQSDIATEVSIHARSLIDLYVRIKSLESGV